MIGDALERGDLVEILEDWKQPDTIVHAVIATESRQRRAVSGFLEFMKSRWCSQPGFLEAAHTFGKTEQGQIAFEGCNVSKAATLMRWSAPNEKSGALSREETIVMLTPETQRSTL